MRILMVSDVYFPRVNGVSTSIQTFRADLMAMGHRVVLVAPCYPGAAAVDDGEAVIRIHSRAVPRDPEDRMFSRGRLLALTPELRRERFDLVHVQTPFVAHYAGVELARRLSLPLVESYHTYFEHYLHHYVPALPTRLLQAVARRFTVAQCRQVDAVISPSRQMAEALRAYGVGTPIEVLPTGLPADRFVPGDRDRFRRRQGIAPGRPLALFVGRVAHEKNIDFLLRMLVPLQRAVPDVLLVVAGEGPAEAHLRSQVHAAGLDGNVKFIGYLERGTELRDCYRAADVFVFASRTETQGLVLLEAMAQGTPVVSTAVMGTVDVLAGAAGATIVAEDEAAFAAAVASLLREPARRESLGSLAREDAQRWSSRSMAERLVALYLGTIARGPGGFAAGPGASPRAAMEPAAGRQSRVA
jgi:glycosyltransferase involved in cell wall biosynthesis